MSVDPEEIPIFISSPSSFGPWGVWRKTTKNEWLEDLFANRIKAFLVCSHPGMCRPANLFWDQSSSLESSSWVLKFSKPKFRKLPNKHTSFTNFSPSGLVAAAVLPTKKSGDNSLRGWYHSKETMNQEKPAVCYSSTEENSRTSKPSARILWWKFDHRYTSTQVAKGNHTCSKAEKHHLLFNFHVVFLLIFKLAFFWYIS